MKTLGGWMIANDHNADIASVCVDGCEGGIYAVTKKGINCDVQIYLKMQNEKRVLLTTLPDNFAMNSLRDLLEEYIEMDFVTNWNPIFLLEPHIECMAG